MPGLVIGTDGNAHATIGDLAAGENRDLMIPFSRSDGSTPSWSTSSWRSTT